MTTYQLDPDVVKWNLHLLDVRFVSNNGSPETVTCYEEDLSKTESVQEGYFYPIYPLVENDEVIAHALQEELARTADSDASGSTSAENQYQNESVLAQDWLGPSGRQLTSGSGFLNNQEESRNRGTLLCDIQELYLEDEHQDTLPQIEHESAIDDELSKRINKMVPIRHVPKINGEIPSVDESVSDHERLLKRLQLYDLVELKISGDGNCQFRSLSDQIYRTPEHHKFVREQVVNQLKAQPELYDNYVPMAYGDYLKKMSISGEWGDHVTLQAASDSFGIKICIITSFKDTCFIEILPQSLKSNRVIFLSFWAEVHYNSIYPLEELPVEERKKKKSQWLSWT